MHIKKIVFGILIVFICIFGLVQFSKISQAYTDNDSLTVPINFQMTEYLDKNTVKDNISSIDVSLPSSTWNITNIELNFAGIQPKCETKVIEDSGVNYVDVNRYNKGWGVQINLIEPTIIYGVYIYGFVDGNPQENVYVQINGYDKLQNTPNDTVYGTPVLINISNTQNWYLQKFSSPISLSAGQYYLVVNGTQMEHNDYEYYFWSYNNAEAIKSPNLNVSYYSCWENEWIYESFGQTLSYKLIQRINRVYNPQEINMTANVNGIEYSVLNGDVEGNGDLIMTNLNFSPFSDILHIPIKCNQSFSIFFNLNYYLSLNNIFFSEGLVNIRENSDNEWTIIPSISRYEGIYFIKFELPKSWYNFRIYKNRQDITSEILFNGNIVQIPNNIITDDASWLISANSPNTAFSLSLSETEFESEQEIKFSVEVPIIQGIVTFKLMDDSCLEHFSETKEIISKIMTFSYVIPSDFDEGLYKIYIFWNNDTDSGVETQTIFIRVPYTIHQQVQFFIILCIPICSVVGLISYVKINNIRSYTKAKNQEILNKYMDILKLNSIIINEKKSGLYVFEQIFSDMKIDMLLVSGFLEAIRRFGIDVINIESESPIIKIEFEKSMILMSEHDYFRLILIMKEKPSKTF